MEIKYNQALWGEVKVDCYVGEKCDEHERYIECFCDGDMDSESSSDFCFDSKRWPAGTRLQILVPECPNDECDLDAEFQNADGKCECGFDWKEWEAYQYS